MADFILFMHADMPDPAQEGGDAAWEAYIGRLAASGRFQGGSSIGSGLCVRKAGPVPTIAQQLNGFIRVTADSLDEAKTLVAGNPVFEAGGTVEIRELPQDG